MLVILIGMSVPGAKKIRYILPMAPAAALLAAYPFTLSNEADYFFWLRYAVIHLLLLFPAILLVTLITLIFYLQTIPLTTAMNWLITFLCVMQTINFIVYKKYPAQSTLFILGMSVLIFS